MHSSISCLIYSIPSILLFGVIAMRRTYIQCSEGHDVKQKTELRLLKIKEADFRVNSALYVVLLSSVMTRLQYTIVV